MLTVLTTTYNRAHCLSKLYRSLQEQDSKEFEWIVIDDGSTDNTESLIKGWQEMENGFPILYEKQKNGGKHRAVNAGIELAKGAFVFIVDSDDYLTKSAVSKAEKWIGEIEGNSGFAGISGTKGKSPEDMLGEFPEKVPFVDATNLERMKKKLRGDKAEIYRTQLLKEYPFPEIEGEKFLPENVVWDEIAHDGYKIRWYPDILTVIEYREDGLTRNANQYIADNFQGYTLAKQKIFRYYSFPYNWVGLVSYIKAARERSMTNQEIRKAMGLSHMENIIGNCFYIVWRLLKRAG